jgi:hypothetical protein
VTVAALLLLLLLLLVFLLVCTCLLPLLPYVAAVQLLLQLMQKQLMPCHLLPHLKAVRHQAAIKRVLRRTRRTLLQLLAAACKAGQPNALPSKGSALINRPAASVALTSSFKRRSAKSGCRGCPRAAIARLSSDDMAQVQTLRDSWIQKPDYC